MPKMNVRRDPDGLYGDTIIGPCPGCDLWTIQLTRSGWTTSELNETVESMLQDHLLECAGLQEIVANTR